LTKCLSTIRSRLTFVLGRLVFSVLRKDGAGAAGRPALATCSLSALGGRTFRSDIKHGPTYTVIPSGATRLFLPPVFRAPGRVERNLLLPFAVYVAAAFRLASV
jgi:hypothetical protein